MRKKWIKRIVSASLCAAIGFTAVAATSNSKADAATPKSIELINYGKKYLGVPYRFGAPSGVTYAFDCSSFTQFVFKKYEVSLPRTAVAQASKGVKVDKGYLSMGDLVFFRTSGSRISHVGIYAGNNQMLHSSSSKGITITSINSTYWKSKYVTARRVLN
ncbi:C40 family peptidase [Paenibacillus cisolokensis]|uniref:C40 family peptidase n=1 Tax=Paenibacillus cisolokensis TaxID=1658519 RepID=UPI003D28B073